MIRFTLTVIAAAALAISTLPARADVIGFDAATSGFASYVEGNFTGTASGAFNGNGSNAGNPPPSIFPVGFVATLTITENTTGLFTFDSFDLVSAWTDAARDLSYSFSGFLSSVQVINQSSVVSVEPLGAATIINNSPATVLDNLQITISYVEEKGVNMDNINVKTAAVPLPASAILLMGRIVGLAAMRRTALAE